MEIRFTLHAQEQIQERKIHNVWVEETIKFPDLLTIQGNKNYAVKKLNGKTLKVVFIKEKYIKIITCYFVK